MSDPHSSRPGARGGATSEPRGLLERVLEFLHPGPDSKTELIETLADAEQRELIEPQSRQMLEGVLRMAELSAGDVMVAAPRMDVLDIQAPYDDILAAVIDTGHSRFPVYEERRDNIIGILLAKDLLKLQRAPDLSLRTLLRPVVFVPESKGLNELLRDFRSNRNHLAIVIDEFGNTAGLITIEDVLEEIVGEINDEHDADAEATPELIPAGDRRWQMSGRYRVDDLNAHLDVGLPEDDDYDTVAGFLLKRFGRIPKAGETTAEAGWSFEVAAANSTQILMVRLTAPDDGEGSPEVRPETTDLHASAREHAS